MGSNTLEPFNASASPPYVRLQGISKAFGGVQALNGVDIDFLDGEIQGLLGENGSGKSTLIKVLAGFHIPDQGRLVVRGELVDLPMKPGGYRDLGFAFVHQDLGLIPSLTVIENLRMERFAAGRALRHISWRGEERVTRRLFEEFGAPWISPRATVSDLRPIERALVAIVRALSNLAAEAGERDFPGRFLILDEPTAFLSRAEAEQLFATLHDVVSDGTSVLFVSHKLHEILDLTDRVTVLRDGEVVGTRFTEGATEDDLARMVLGRDRTRYAAGLAGAPLPGSAGPPLLAAEGLCVAGQLSEMHLEVAGGEILGLTGLEGSGFEEILYALFGLCGHPVSGTLLLKGVREDLDGLAPETAMRMGIALVPGDRQTQGCVSSLSVRENLAAPILGEFWSGAYLSWHRIDQAARALAERFDIRPREVDRDVSTLSGGNQQKVVLAKWLQTTPRVLLLHEPTQGVDVGARQEIFRFIRTAVREDNCALVASTDFEQLEELCTRVLVVGDGQVTADLRGPGISKDRIAEECLLSQRSMARGAR